MEEVRVSEARTGFRRLGLKVLSGLTFATVISAMSFNSASADLKLCNTTSSRVGIAIGYKDAKGWATEGWWNVASNTCETLLKGKLIARYYYIHAIDYDRGGEWAGKSFMCTNNKSFTIRGVRECAKRGYNRTGFFEVDTREEQDWTVKLADPVEAASGPKQ
jgi:uncharacterized membrane protein